MYVSICPKCGERRLKYAEKENQFCKWIEGKCTGCGYEFKIKDYEYDFVQPDHPAFYYLYGNDPDAYKKARFTKLLKDLKETKRKEGLEEKYWRMKKTGAYKGRKLHDWEIDKIKQIVINGESY